MSILEKGLAVEDVLPFSILKLNYKEANSFKNGAFLNPENLKVLEHRDLSDQYFWILDETNVLLGLGEKKLPHELRPKINFMTISQSFELYPS